METSLKLRAQIIVLKKAFIDQNESIKKLRQECRPVAELSEIIKITLSWSKKSASEILSCIADFLNYTSNSFKNNLTINREYPSGLVCQEIKLRILQSMNEYLEKYKSFQILELMQNLVIQLNGLASSLEFGTSEWLFKKALIFLILDSESFIHDIPEFFSALKNDAGIDNLYLKTRDSSIIGCNLLSLINNDIGPPLKRIESNNQCIQTDEFQDLKQKKENQVETKSNFQTQLLQQYSTTIQELHAKLLALSNSKCN